ncbi:hypothetical protein BV911_01495 [Pseudoruegeria sp. SK021]|nr:hypothetical protein BV911_01495 [Pseudoruegeria sp. SK021]
MALAALVLTVLLWSGNFVAGRIMGGLIDPLTLTSLRWLIALAGILPFAAVPLWRSRRALMRRWYFVAGLGLTGVALFNVCVYSALQRIPVASATLMLAVVPFAILTGSVLLGKARLRLKDGAALLVSVIGVLILLTDGHLESLMGLKFGAGDLWMLLAVLAWTVYTLLLRASPADVPPDAMLAASMIAGLVLLLPLAGMWGTTDLTLLPLPVWGGVLYVGLGASLVAFWCWGFGVRRIGPEAAGFFINLMPVFSAVLAWLLLGETLGASQMAGAAAILGAIVLSSWRGPASKSVR